MSVYILDVNMQVCPIGVPGELYVAGIGVGRGYLNRPELTYEHFLENPFGKSFERLYRTGDRAMWLPDGNVEFLGRIDEQVKVRGYRIELGEIEHALDGLPMIRQGVVVAHSGEDGSKQLVGYVVMAEGEALDREVVTEQLKEQLPAYMVPLVWLELETLPLTRNGKVDKRSLPEVSLTDAQDYVGPSTAIEEELVGIWSEVLGIPTEELSVEANFFKLGGHSLMAIRVLSKIRQVYSVELPVSDLFGYPTIAGLSRRIESGVSTEVPPLEVMSRPVHVPLSYSQERLWFIDRYEGSTHYHIPQVLRLAGSVSVAALSSAVRAVIDRHEVLRTVYKEIDGVPYQKVIDSSGWQLGRQDGQSWSEQALSDWVDDVTTRPFDLSQDYMLRCELVDVPGGDYLLVLVVHHIASDGWSDAILLEELVHCYRAYESGASPELAKLPLQYADYSLWQRAYLSGSTLEQKLSYWQEQLAEVAPLSLPTDYPRPSQQRTRGSSRSYALGGRSLQEGLQARSQESGATLFMTLLSAFKVLLYRYSGQTDLCVGSPIANRSQTELEGMIGFFVNTLALRSDLSGDPVFRELLAQVRAVTLGAYGHQDVPFEKVVEALVGERDLSRSPLFQVMFVLQNNREAATDSLAGLELEGYEGLSVVTSKFDLTFNVVESEDGLVLEVEYNTDLYRGETIDRMVGHYSRLLEGVVADPDKRISKLKMLSEAEEEELRKGFNPEVVPYEGGSVLELFSSAVAQDPDRTALVHGGEAMSYGELDQRSNQLAHYLRAQGVAQETLVGVCMDRSFDMVIGILGILKAGGGYVPLSPTHPQVRLEKVIKDSGLGYVITTSGAVRALFTGSEAMVVALDEEGVLSGYATDALTNELASHHVFNVIYTSGSTGVPKGVLVTHSSVYNLIKSQSETFSISEEEVILQFSDYTFDASVEQLFLGLSHGGKIILPSQEELLSDGLPSMIVRHGVTHLHATPGYLESLGVGVSFPSLRRVISGGDVCSVGVASRWSL
ncbi:MAG: condensation domain-containing protein, partial [Bacteroidota bacterium]